MADVYSYSLQTSKGELKLADYKDKDILIVNVASRCGLTPQYKDLQALSEKYAGKLEVVGQPCNQVRSKQTSLTPVQGAGAGDRRRDPPVLPGQLRGHVPHCAQGRRQWRGRDAAVPVPQEPRGAARPGH
jgi:hypothetical protein